MFIFSDLVPEQNIPRVDFFSPQGMIFSSTVNLWDYRISCAVPKCGDYLYLLKGASPSPCLPLLLPLPNEWGEGRGDATRQGGWGEG